MLDVDKIYHIDCIEGMKLLEDSKIDLILTSPPYFNVKEYSTWPTYEGYLDFLKIVFTEAYRVLKEGRMCVVNISAIIIPRESRQHESKRINLPAHFSNMMEEIGFKFLEDIIWEKPEPSVPNRNGGFFRSRQPCAYKPNNVTEYVFVFQKPMKGLIDKIVRSYKGEIKEQSLVPDGYERSNVWKIAPETRSKHPAPFPEALAERVIRYYSYKGDLVLDIFSGSGTTAISSIKLERHYLGYEIHRKYIEIFEERRGNIKRL